MDEKASGVGRFSPGVMVPGVGLVEVPGWMWVLAFALRGVPWAMEEVSGPEFGAVVRAWVEEDARRKASAGIDRCLKEVARLRKELGT